MINGQNDYEKYKILRPLYSEHIYDYNGIPIIKKDNFDYKEWNNTYLCNFKNIKSNIKKSASIVTMFNYDNVINRLWNDPFRYLAKLLEYKAICTPDYSVYPDMNINDIRFNVYRNRWIGCMLQEKGYKVIPTIQWALENTYDICFSGVEKYSVVIISTLGCINNKQIFLDGFNEMKRRIEPSLIIVFGKMIAGMTGTFLQYEYKDCFINKKDYEQLQLFPKENIFTLKEGDTYGK